MRLFFPLTLMTWLVTPALAQQCAVQPAGLGKPSPLSAQPPPAESRDALKRVVASGAQLLQVGSVHGYETGVAHTGQQLFVYYTPNDHSVLLGGTIIPVPYETLHKLAGDRVHDLAPYHSIRGMFVQNGGRFQVIYDTPDHQAAIAGSLWDADGKDVTRSQIKSVPGAVPTIAIDTPGTRAATKVALSSLHGGVIGQTGAPEATMLIDPQCMYSIKSIHALLPAVQAGRLRLKIGAVTLTLTCDRLG
ncbi:thiol:disulfide interchange protein (plasmid) [Kozakia baliensis]|uniref:thiol:disulfide interchange protein n=1 Tax=Kozakia baliensis TaxID=153496 RepID=UPI00345BB2FD